MLVLVFVVLCGTLLITFLMGIPGPPLASGTFHFCPFQVMSVSQDYVLEGLMSGGLRRPGAIVSHSSSVHVF